MYSENFFSLESKSRASGYSYFIERRYIGTGGGFELLIRIESMIPVVWHRAAKLTTVLNLGDMGLSYILILHLLTIVSSFGVKLE